MATACRMTVLEYVGWGVDKLVNAARGILQGRVKRLERSFAWRMSWARVECPLEYVRETLPEGTA